MAKYNTPLKLIKAEYGDSPNFMTPHREGCGWIDEGRIAYELSTGTGFPSEGCPAPPIWGVSVVKALPRGKTDRLTEHSDCFRSRALAKRHIADLKRRRAEL